MCESFTWLTLYYRNSQGSNIHLFSIQNFKSKLYCIINSSRLGLGYSRAVGREALMSQNFEKSHYVIWNLEMQLFSFKIWGRQPVDQRLVGSQLGKTSKIPFDARITKKLRLFEWISGYVLRETFLRLRKLWIVERRGFEESWVILSPTYRIGIACVKANVKQEKAYLNKCWKK